MINANELKEKINIAKNKGNSFLFAIDFEMNEGFIIESPEKQSEVLWRVGEKSNFDKKEDSLFDLKPQFISLAQYKERFDISYKGLMRGDSFLTNLTVKTPLKGLIDLKEIAQNAKSKYLLFVPNKFVCFSPEPFIRISKKGEISSFPMKGTISAEEENAAQKLLADKKEQGEHFTIVDLIRSDLSRVACEVRVEAFRYLEQLSTNRGNILQASSKITGKLLPEYLDNYGDLIFELLPAGSVSGAPKPSTLNLIKKAEAEDRGFYCGIFGYFDGEELDCAVIIRYIEQSEGRFYYRSGGGITVKSKMEREYEEIKTKIYIPQ